MLVTERILSLPSLFVLHVSIKDKLPIYLIRNFGIGDVVRNQSFHSFNMRLCFTTDHIGGGARYLVGQSHRLILSELCDFGPERSGRGSVDVIMIAGVCCTGRDGVASEHANF